MRTIHLLIISISLASCISIGSSSLSIHEIENLPELQDRDTAEPGFWDAMRHLDTTFAQQYPDSSEERAFASALSTMMGGDYDSAIYPLEQLASSSNDSTMVERCGTLLESIYMLQSDWPALIDLQNRLPSGIDDMNTVELFTAWYTTASEEIDFPSQPIEVMMKKSLPGIPMIDVRVNGHAQTFWIDTGAAFTVLASDVADACGVHPLVDSTSTVGTSTDIEIELLPGVIEKLEIEDLSFKNHPVFIIEKGDLEFRILKIFRLLKIDGILGWNAIQKLKLELNYAQETIRISQPKPEVYTEKNFHFIEQPFVTLRDTAGIPVSFFLDTGANMTGLYPPAFSVFDTTRAEVERALVGGAGGSQVIQQITLEDQSILLGKTRIDFNQINGNTDRGIGEEAFVAYDGVLGSDVPQKGILILDFQNAWCGLKPIE